MDKQAVRKALKQQRQGFSVQQVKASSRKVGEHIKNTRTFHQASCILGYLAFGRELSVDQLLLEALQAGKRVCVPYVLSGSEMVAAEIHTLEELVLDRFGIRTVKEPVRVVEPNELDLILVPGVAFTYSGHRMGMGAGFYDRYLPKASQAITLGIAYEQLMQESLPLEEFDYPVDYIVNEKGIFQTGH